MHRKRENIFYDNATLSVLEKINPVRYQELLTQVSESELKRVQKEIELFSINKCWADHLLYIENVLDGVQMVSKLKGPSSTRTYMVQDGTDQLNLIAAVGEIAAIAVSAPLYALYMLVEKFKKRKK